MSWFLECVIYLSLFSVVLLFLGYFVLDDYQNTLAKDIIKINKEIKKKKKENKRLKRYMYGRLG